MLTLLESCFVLDGRTGIELIRTSSHCSGQWTTIENNPFNTRLVMFHAEPREIMNLFARLDTTRIAALCPCFMANPNFDGDDDDYYYHFDDSENNPLCKQTEPNETICPK